MKAWGLPHSIHYGGFQTVAKQHEVYSSFYVGNSAGSTVKPVSFAFPLFHEPEKFAKITGRENLNTVAFQCSRKQKRQNYGVQNK